MPGEELVYHTIVPAVLSGAVQSVLFNPVDRALYLRVHNRRSFLHASNWSSPFQGFSNAATYRTLCAASYLFWQDTSKVYGMKHYSAFCEDNPLTVQLSVGLVSGTFNGVCLNQLQNVKYRMWTDGEGSFRSVCRQMYRDAGIRVFFRGIKVCIARDALFGVVYETLRKAPPIVLDRLKIRPATMDTGSSSTVVQTQRATAVLASKDLSWDEFFFNLLAAVAASTISAPLNYCRNIIYGAPAKGCPLRTTQLLTYLGKVTIRERSWRCRWRYLNAKLNIGWGSLRVGLGMAVGQYLFGEAKVLLHRLRK